jgi:hypothetical protein
MSSSTNGVVARPQVIDGEAVDPTDFNNLSAWSRAYINDLLLSTLMRRQFSAAGPQQFGGAAMLYSLAGSGAPRNGTTLARSIGCNSGPLFYVPNGTITVDGRTPQAKMYYLSTNEINAQFAAADPTNPRFDAIYVRISEVDGPTTSRNFEDATGAKSTQALIVDRRTKLEWTVVQGTPAAKPGIPGAPDASWAPWGVWFIPAAFASLFNNLMIFDYRTPMNAFTRHIVPASQMSGTSWTISGVSGYAQSTAGGGFSNSLYAMLSRRSGRIMGCSMNYLAADAGSFMKIITRYPSAGSILTYPPTFQPPGINAGAPFTDIDGYTLQGGYWVDVNGFTDQNSIGGYQLLPLWATGLGTDQEFPTGSNPNDGGTLYDTQLAGCVWCPNAAGDKIIACSFDIAG